MESRHYKKTFIPDKSENEGIQESCFALAEQAGLILLLTEKLAPFGEPRRAQPDRYPDFGRNLAPAFPPPLIWSRTVASGSL